MNEAGLLLRDYNGRASLTMVAGNCYRRAILSIVCCSTFEILRMAKKITIIGAGIVGIATASYLRRDGHDVTVIDMRPPGEYTSSGNAGILSPGSCVPIAMPGILKKVPGYLADPLGPLKVRAAYFPQALPWL